MKINCHDTFSPCKEVILGDINNTLLDTVENENQKFILKDVIHETKEDLENIQKVLESFDISVLRPNVNANFSCPIATPYFETYGWHLPLTPRDIFFIYEDKFIVTTPMDRNRYFEHHCYENIIQYYFDNDSQILSMPFSALSETTYLNINEEYQYFNNDFPMISAANIMKYGKDIFIIDSMSANKKGAQWIKRQLGDEYRVHTLPECFSGHIDSIINILKPGVVSSVAGKSLLPDFFKNWEVICLEDTDLRKMSIQNDSALLISDNIQDDDFEGTYLGYNMFPIDQEHVLLNSFTDKSILKQLEKNKITPVFADIQHSNFLNQGHTCCILDTVRDSNLEDYTS